MKTLSLRNLLKYFIASVWLVNGLYCKVLNYVPRHEEIIVRILGDEYPRPLTIMIGVSEILIAIWIISNIKSKWCAIFQIVLVAVMNIIELIFAKDLLLWGSFNSFFAMVFILLVYYYEFVMQKTRSGKQIL